MKAVLQKLLALFGIKIVRAQYNRKFLPKPNIDNVQVLAHLYYQFNKKLKVLQVGACDGFTSDSIYPYVKKGSINAFLVEPITTNFKRLSTFYEGNNNTTLINAAVADKDETRVMYFIKDEGKWKDVGWARQLASFYKQHLLKHGFEEHEIAEQQVECKTIRTMVNEYNIVDLDVLLIDTEGFDGEVIKMAMQQNIMPNYIFFENAQLVQNYTQKELDELYSLLEHHGYCWTHDRINTMAVKKNYINILTEEDHEAH